ncbi:MAG: hypothetical protein HON90_16165, partial [Halobacteriovoraceae bacterium]|nr:hypothetical protein [Halobacteriovoraceae bacterium]
LVSVIAILPIASVSFAADYNLEFSEKNLDRKETEKELLDKLSKNSLPLKYYYFLEDKGITSSEQLVLPDFDEERERLLDEYIKDFVDPYARVSGIISVF